MDKWITLIWVFAGGGLGAVLRVLLDGCWSRSVKFAGFPIGIMGINLLGCLLIGLLYGYFLRGREETASWVFPLFGAGLLGGFTTFSTFGMQTVFLIREEKWMMAACYVLLSVLGGLILAAVGYWAAHRV